MSSDRRSLTAVEFKEAQGHAVKGKIGRLNSSWDSRSQSLLNYATPTVGAWHIRDIDSCLHCASPMLTVVGLRIVRVELSLASWGRALSEPRDGGQSERKPARTERGLHRSPFPHRERPRTHDSIPGPWLRHLDWPLVMLIDSAALHVYDRFAVRIDDYLRSGAPKCKARYATNNLVPP